MLLVLLHYFFAVRIELKNFPVAAASQENILLVFCWMELNAVGCALIGEASDYFASLGVPQLNYFIKTGRQESSAIICEADVLDSFLVPHVSPYTLTMGQNIPNFAGAIMAGAEH